MSHEPTYGATFVSHLTKLGRHVPHHYEDLQRVKAMNQASVQHSFCTSPCPSATESSHPTISVRRSHRRELRDQSRFKALGYDVRPQQPLDVIGPCVSPRVGAS